MSYSSMSRHDYVRSEISKTCIYMFVGEVCNKPADDECHQVDGYTLRRVPLCVSDVETPIFTNGWGKVLGGEPGGE